MREIPDEVLDLIAGGYASSAEASMPVVSVHGSLPDWGWGGGGDGPNLGSQSVSAPVSVPDCTDQHTSPAPPVVPKDVDLNELRNTMLSIASEIKAMNPDIEHGALVVRSADGTLRVGEMAHGDEFKITISVGLRAGDTIVGYIHSHPEDHLNQTLPSSHDFFRAAELREKSYVDKGMMLYILDNKSGDVFEYHAGTSPNTKRSGANITDDTSKPCG